MKSRRKYIKKGVIFIAVLAALFLISFFIIKEWRHKTVRKNSILCNRVALQLADVSKEKIQYFGNKTYFELVDISSKELTIIDTALTAIVDNLLSKHNGLEGGYFFHNLDKFVGYSYPSSEPPKPVYGPPPRSYNIIREQCLKSINEDTLLSELHGFDPAVFPLVTIPIKYNKDIVGTIWIRKHIERELPLIKLQNVINVAVIFLVISVVILLWVSYSLKINIQSIRNDLEIVHQVPDFRLQNRGRLFTGIINSINKTLERLHLENYQKRQLEYKLLQKEKMASIGRIVAGVAHEVRTPLANIKTRMQMWQQNLKDGNANTAASEFITEDSIKLVVNETDRLSNLIKRLLIYSQPINRKFESTDIREFLKEIIKLIQIQKNNPNIHFNFIENDIPKIKADPYSLRQVFINVLSNSIEAMPKGGTITIKISNVYDDIIVEIDDEGEGIPADIFDKIFELFVTSKSSGVGLGLSISYEIIKAHNGEIFYENMKNGGVKCTIKLPLNTN